jgi:hypothetical protein
MVTGFEAGFYRDVGIIREHTARIANALEKLADYGEARTEVLRAASEKLGDSADLLVSLVEGLSKE